MQNSPLPSGKQSGNTPPSIPITISLSEQEREQFHRCERVLRQGLDTFLEVGQALMTIRDCRFYRVTHSTFEAYCRERWGIGRSYAWRVIGAAERLQFLPQGSPLVPKNEYQVRPFLKLKPEAFAAGWAEVVKLATDGEVTPKLVRSVARSMAENAANRCPSLSKKRARRAHPKIHLGQILSLVLETKRRVQKGEKESVLDTLERIQELLLK
jgi:hypothetical protein